jgi:hypothetical protein
MNALLVDNTSVGAVEHKLVNEDSSAEQVLSYNAIKQRLITHSNMPNEQGLLAYKSRDHK